MKQIRLTVNLFFSVPDDYEITDCETVENLNEVTLYDEANNKIAKGVTRHESIETTDVWEEI